MPASFNRRRMIAVFPISALPFLSQIKFLPGSSGYQLYRFGDNIPIAIIPDDKMDMIGCDCIIEHAQSKSLPRFKKPPKPTSSVSAKFQKKFLFVTTVGDMPYIAGYVMPACSWHGLYP
jgi:hypothetical protein